LRDVNKRSAKFDTITKAWDAIQVSSHVKSERSMLQRAGFLPPTPRHPFDPLPSAPSTDQLHTDSVEEISELSGDTADDILNSHLILKNKLSSNINQLKDIGDQFSPEAKKIVDKTWKQVQDILKGGVGVGTADQLRRLVQDKTQEVRKLADQA
jgi:hypothetical protein